MRSKKAELNEYRNLYNDRMEALVQAKIEGKEIATVATKDSGPPTINIMDALKASLARKAPHTPGSKKLGTRARPTRPAKRKKTG